VNKNGRGQKWVWQTLKKMKKYEKKNFFKDFFFLKKDINKRKQKQYFGAWPKMAVANFEKN
jgi:hypothetical protein